MKNLKTIGLLVLLIFGVLFIYFIKCQLDICMIKNFPLDKYPPLSLLQNRNPYHIVYSPETNIDLLTNRLPFLSGIGIWEELWMREKGMVILSHDNSHSNLSCLLITSRSIKDWALVHKKLFQVNPGDVFSYSGRVKIAGLDPRQKHSGMINQAVGALSVILYDADMNVREWNYAIVTVSKADNWKKVEREFNVPIGVKYIRFRLTGWGVGKVWFSEIKFKKEIASSFRSL